METDSLFVRLCSKLRGDFPRNATQIPSTAQLPNQHPNNCYTIHTQSRRSLCLLGRRVAKECYLRITIQLRTAVNRGRASWKKWLRIEARVGGTGTLRLALMQELKAVDGRTVLIHSESMWLDGQRWVGTGGLSWWLAARSPPPSSRLATSLQDGVIMRVV